MGQPSWRPIRIFLLCSSLLVIALSEQIVHKAASREELLETLKGRYNYASFDCASRILSTNKGCKSASSILQSQKDSYLRNLCVYDDKHVVLELCQDIRIDTLAIANFEYFSSMVRDFQVSVSKKYPPNTGGWKLVGNFTAENSRREQVFQVTGTTMYARYVRLDFNTHHGNEYYCLLSVVRIYGKTMMEDFEESAAVGLNPATVTGTIATVKATVVSSKPIEESLPTISPTQSCPESTTTFKEVTSPVDFTDLMELFRKQQSSFCQAPTPTTTITTDGVSEESDGAPILPQENVFKAIYDRLQQLEKNVTRSARNLEGELRRIGGDLRYVQDELGVTEGQTILMGGKKSSFRMRLIQHLEKKNFESMKSLADQVRMTLDEVDKNDRLVFWIAIFGALQIAGLICLVILGFFLGWFRSDDSPVNPRRSMIHRRSSSTGDLHPQYIVNETEQQVPDRYQGGTSPAKSDLIMTASRPLLLDETEADLIDATFVPSPLSSISSMDFGLDSPNAELKETKSVETIIAESKGMEATTPKPPLRTDDKE
jgi:hypothetical protein